MNDTATAGARRPSPRPRPAGEPSRPVDERPNLRVVPPPNDPQQDGPETRSLKPEAAQDATPTVEFPQVSASDGANAGAVQARVSGFWASTKATAGRTGAYWTPPNLFTEQPASLADLTDYARHAPWTAQNSGVLRGAALWYHRGAYAYTVVSRYREWTIQRPGRLVAHLGVTKLAAMTTPGIWVVDHLVYPVAQFAGHLFL